MPNNTHKSPPPRFLSRIGGVCWNITLYTRACTWIAIHASSSPGCVCWCVGVPWLPCILWRYKDNYQCSMCWKTTLEGASSSSKVNWWVHDDRNIKCWLFHTFISLHLFLCSFPRPLLHVIKTFLVYAAVYPSFHQIIVNMSIFSIGHFEGWSYNPISTHIISFILPGSGGHNGLVFGHLIAVWVLFL